MFKKDVIFIVDISGSMQGKPLEDTKNALAVALSKLDPGDSFNIVAFNGETYLFSTSMELATKEAVERARQWIGINFIAGGSTNICAPLTKVSSYSYLFIVDLVLYSLAVLIYFLFQVQV